jgi:hypothetical protein
MKPPDDSPNSAFVREMKAAFRQRCAASTPAEKRQTESAMLEIMRRYLGPAAWRATQQQDQTQDVPRGTSRPEAVVDRKLAAAGPEAD